MKTLLYIALICSIILLALFLLLPFTPEGRERIRTRKARYVIGIIFWLFCAGYSFNGIHSANNSHKEVASSSTSKHQSSAKSETRSQSSASSISSDDSSSESYQQVTYDDLTRNKGEALSNKNVQISGTISKIHHDDGIYVVIVNMNDDPTEKVMVPIYSEFTKNKKPTVGDTVTIKGTGGGMQEQPEELTGGENIPYIDCDQPI